MQKFWNICELEEFNGSFFEYSVAAVPEIWIKQLEDGSLICNWPKSNASKKIRSFADPEDGGNWMTYKCRFLMNGEKYSIYAEAKDAELLAQNVSCKIDTTKILNSTMGFDVSDIDTESIEDEVVDESSESFECRNAFARDCNSTMDFDVSDEIEEIGSVHMIGNDSTQFNHDVLMGGGYCSENVKIDAAAVDQHYYSSDDLGDINDFNDSVASGYSNRFLQTDLLTSTAIGDISVLNNNDTIMSSIKALEANISSFYQNLKKDLDEIKEHLGNVRKDEGQTHQNSIPIWTDNQTINNIIIIDDVSGENSPAHTDKNDCGNQNAMSVLMNKHGIDEKNLVDDVPPEKNPTVNEPLMASDDVLMDQNIAEEFSPPSSPLSIAQEDVDIPNNATYDLILPAELKMKVKEKPEFAANEDLLELDVKIERKFVNDLLPHSNEDEGSYIKRTVKLLFEDNFFLDDITWKPEKSRQCIKHSNTLKYWKESFATKFGPDEKNERYMGHFRRLKSAMRARKNSAAKRASEKCRSQNGAPEFN